MLFTLYKSNVLNFKLTPQLFNKTINKSLNIDLISKVYKGLDKIYEKEKEVIINFKAKSNPTIELMKEYIYLIAPINVEICLFEGECILEYDTNLEIKGDVFIKENQFISGKILSIISKNTFINKTNLTCLTNEYLEDKFNLLSDLIKAFANFYIYDYIHIDLPKYKGISFDDMTFKHENNYLILNYNLKWDMRRNDLSYYFIFIIFILICLVTSIYFEKIKKKNKKEKSDLLLLKEGEELKEMN